MPWGVIPPPTVPGASGAFFNSPDRLWESWTAYDRCALAIRSSGDSSAKRSSKSAAISANDTSASRCSNNVSASRIALASEALTACSTRQTGSGSAGPKAKIRFSPRARCTSSMVMSSSLPVSDQPPPCPLTERTYPASRRPAIVRRTTTGLVHNMTAAASDVSGPSMRLIWISRCSILERRASKVTNSDNVEPQYHVTSDVAKRNASDHVTQNVM